MTSYSSFKKPKFHELPVVSHNSHFQFGYDEDSFVFRSSPNQNWNVKYGRPSRAPLDFKTECIQTAKTIRSSTTDPIHILFSGGVDSEVVLRSFVAAQIPVTAAIMRFKNDLNIHDISWAVIACEQLKVPYRFYDLDLLRFWDDEAWEYANPTYCISPQLLSTMWLVDQIDGYPVMGSGECLFVKHVDPNYVPGVSPYVKSDWFLWEKEKIAAWYRHFIVRNRNGCPGFFQYTPELIYSYLSDPFVQTLIGDQIHGKLSTETSKLKIYQQHFSLFSRPKYSGYEKVQIQDAQVRAKLVQAFPGTNQIFKTSCTELIKNLSVLGHDSVHA